MVTRSDCSSGKSSDLKDNFLCVLFIRSEAEAGTELSSDTTRTPEDRLLSRLPPDPGNTTGTPEDRLLSRLLTDAGNWPEIS